MTERPILFNGEMVRAILAGTKTQTRRPLRPQPDVEFFGDDLRWLSGPGHSGDGWYYADYDYPDEGSHFARCPYGQPGGRLWVRETWAPVDFLFGSELEEPVRVAYGADRQVLDHGAYRAEMDTYALNWGRVKWRPSIHMPKWASRITLEVTAVRVERVQNISADDAVAEGVDPAPHECRCEPCSLAHVRCPASQSGILMEFRPLWDSVYAKRGFGWEANPWVWCVEFRRVER
jgi:hypothetical protein